MTIRKPHFAGSWYPGTEKECRQAIEAFSKQSLSCPSQTRPFKGGIVPHAGWFYSGRIACNTIQCLSQGPLPQTIVIFGRHLHPGSKNYLLPDGLWATPLGTLEVDQALAKNLAAEFDFKIETASQAEPDNTIELQLPFIKYFFKECMILPIGVAPAKSALQIGKRIAELARELNRPIQILGSTDLTHYGQNYDFTPHGTGEAARDWVKNQNDQRMLEMMLALKAENLIEESLENSNACCAGAVAAAIAAVREMGGRQGDLLAYYTSYDIRPDNSFVGYGGILFQ